VFDGESHKACLQRRFYAWFGGQLPADPDGAGAATRIFQQGQVLFQGVVPADPRSTDDAWTEAVVTWLHDDGRAFSAFALPDVRALAQPPLPLSQFFFSFFFFPFFSFYFLPLSLSRARVLGPCCPANGCGLVNNTPHHAHAHPQALQWATVDAQLGLPACHAQYVWQAAARAQASAEGGGAVRPVSVHL
jgi:hypothetical protein